MNEINHVYYQPDPEKLAGQITAQYAPAPNAANADELVSGLDLLEQLREVDGLLGPSQLYDAMLKLGFVPANIEGHLYWPVMLV